MSDHYQIVAFIDLQLDEARAVATKIIEDLRKRKILGGLIPGADDANATRRMLFKTGDAAASVITGDPIPRQSRRAAYGVEIVIGWWAHGDGDVTHSAMCPACGHVTEELTFDDGPLRHAASKIADEQGGTVVGCASCGEETLLLHWRFSPPLYFAPLAMRFGNWGPLSIDLVRLLETLSGSRARVAHELVA